MSRLGPSLRWIGCAGITGFGIALMDVWQPVSPTLYRRRDTGAPDTYWADVAKEPDVLRPQLEKVVNAEIVVVGGGLAGLHVALALTERGKSVIVIEKERIGWGASGMSKGLAVAGLQIDEDDIAATAGKEVASTMQNLTKKAQGHLKHLIGKYSIRCGLQESGCIEASAFMDDGSLDTHALSEILGTSSYKSGEFDSTAFAVNPLDLTRGLARACESKGVAIYEETEAERVASRTDGRKMVTCRGGGTITADQVVLCAAEHLSPSLNASLSLATLPIYTWMVATSPIPPEKLPLKKENGPAGISPLVCDDFVALNYWRTTEDGRLLFGALADAYPSTPEEAAPRVRKALSFVYPDIAADPSVSFEYIWGGVLSFSRRAVPLIGRDASGIWYATAFGGHGIVPTCMAGQLLSEAIVNNDRSSLDLFQKSFPPQYCGYPFSRFGASVVIQLFSILDTARIAGFPVPDIPRPW